MYEQRKQLEDRLANTDLDALSRVELSTSQIAEVFYKGTNRLQDFLATVVNGVLNGLLDHSDREKALLGTYWRIYAWLNTLVHLNGPAHLQAILAGTRAVFELTVDMKLLAKSDDVDIERFHAFVKVERYARAKKLADFAPLRHDPQNPDFAKLGCEVEQLTARLWGGRGPKHWSWKGPDSGAQDLGTLAKATNLLDGYVELYKLTSWFVHAGAAGYAGFNAEQLERFVAVAHKYVVDWAAEACSTLFRAMNLGPAFEEAGVRLYRLLEDVQKEAGYAFAERRLREAGLLE